MIGSDQLHGNSLMSLDDAASAAAEAASPPVPSGHEGSERGIVRAALNAGQGGAHAATVHHAVSETCLAPGGRDFSRRGLA